MVFYCVLSVSMVFIVFNSFFKELDFKELEIHRYSLLDTINEYQWISINEYQWISINEFIDGPSMNMVPFFWAFSLGSIGPPLGPKGPGPRTRHLVNLKTGFVDPKWQLRGFRQGRSVQQSGAQLYNLPFA